MTVAADSTTHFYQPREGPRRYAGEIGSRPCADGCVCGRHKSKACAGDCKCKRHTNTYLGPNGEYLEGKERARAQARERYRRGGAAVRATKQAFRIRQRDKTRAIVNDIKGRTPCFDCGGSFIPEVMEFDHPPGSNKVQTVSFKVKGGHGLQGILAEIAKCELVCANCHRVRTVERGIGDNDYHDYT